MLGIVAYAGFFFCFAFMVGSFLQTFIHLVTTYALVVGRKQDVSWNFRQLGLNVMLWTGMTAFLWHYNFGV